MKGHSLKSPIQNIAFAALFIERTDDKCYIILMIYVFVYSTIYAQQAVCDIQFHERDYIRENSAFNLIYSSVSMCGSPYVFFVFSLLSKWENQNKPFKKN